VNRILISKLYLPEIPRLKTNTCGARFTSSLSKFGGNFRRALRAARPFGERINKFPMKHISNDLLVVFDPLIILRKFNLNMKRVYTNGSFPVYFLLLDKKKSHTHTNISFLRNYAKHKMRNP